MTTIIPINQLQQRTTRNGTHSKMIAEFQASPPSNAITGKLRPSVFSREWAAKKKNVALFYVLHNEDDHLLIFFGLYLISANRLTTTDAFLARRFSITQHACRLDEPPPHHTAWHRPWRMSANKHWKSRHAQQLIKVPHQLQMMYETSDSAKMCSTHIPIFRHPWNAAFSKRERV